MRLLLVEDEKNIRDFLKTSLEAELFSVDIAEDGDKGSMLGRVNDYDLIILDYLLPGKNGMQVCKEIRDKGKSVPIIILSVESETGSKIGLLNAGADDYMTKPFSFEELLARIKAMLRRPQTIKEEVLEIGNLVVDVGSQKVLSNGQEVYLTKKEFELLEFLMRNHGQVLSRGLIMEHVWDINADPFSNTIETHILNLRRKLNLAKDQLIRTVPGRGYRVELNVDN